MFEISNAEYTILSLLKEQGFASGYRLNTIIQDRGYQQWADIGMTSIYSGLRKLEHKGLVEGNLVTNKSTQGPRAKEFSLTPAGLTLLIEETSKGLSETRERDRRFDLALSSMAALPSEKARELIAQRLSFLQAEQQRLTQMFESQEKTISSTGLLLFKHTLNFVQSEVKFLTELISNWEEETAFDH